MGSQQLPRRPLLRPSKGLLPPAHLQACPGTRPPGEETCGVSPGAAAASPRWRWERCGCTWAVGCGAHPQLGYSHCPLEAGGPKHQKEMRGKAKLYKKWRERVLPSGSSIAPASMMSSSSSSSGTSSSTVFGAEPPFRGRPFFKAKAEPTATENRRRTLYLTE